jgi:hypothetical protein
MSRCEQTTESICPCGQLIHPRVITNPVGLATIAYRAGDYTSFREALLRARPGEIQLNAWRPGAHGDLAVQMIEWWAYLSDILTFYNERGINQAYIRTAGLPESVNRLIRLLGYRPRPGIGATGVLAALAIGPNPFTLLKGFQIQSKPGPGEQPQIFELDSAVTIMPPLGTPGSGIVQGAGVVEPTPGPAVPVTISNDSPGPVVLAGTSSAVKAGDRVLILPKPDANSATSFAVATVAKVAHAKDPLGNPVTRVYFSNVDVSLSANDITQYHLVGNSRSSQLWQFPADPKFVIRADPNNANNFQIDLNMVARGLKTNDPVLLELLDQPQSAQFAPLFNATEVVWYANPANYTPGGSVTNIDPSQPPPDPKTTLPIPILHTSMKLTGATQPPPDDIANYLVRFAWKELGDLITEPAAKVGGADGSVGSTAPPNPTGRITLQPPADSQFLANTVGAQVLVEDVNGRGAQGIVDTQKSMHVTDPVPPLLRPLKILYNLLPVSRGKTVLNEVLGNGNGLVDNQDFVLQNAPVTYQQSADSKSGDNYSSTVRVWVNGLEWKEVRSFYGQPANAQVFLTCEDAQGKTHVVFGSRLPTGVANVVASYRYGSGAISPPAGALTVVQQPVPGLRGVRNPVPVGGGSDPDPPDKIRRLAPRSVLTFNRAVSVDDYEVIAAQAPGVVRAKAAVAFDPQAQRPRVTVWVGDDSKAVESAQKAFVAEADPNRQPRVRAANPVRRSLSLTIVYDPRRDPTVVQKAVHDALLDPDSGLLGVNMIGIGQAIYDSQIYATCFKVTGVEAVHSLRFGPQHVLNDAPVFRDMILIVRGWRFHPRARDQRHDPGEGSYLLVQDDIQNVTLATEAAS